MKKVIIGLVVLLIIAGLSLPFVNGIMMEKVIRQAHRDANKLYAESGYDISVEIINYDRGFTSSQIEWKVNFGQFKALYGIDEIIVIDRATHGFTGSTTKTSLEKNSWFNEFITTRLNGENPLDITTHYGLTGNIESTVSLAAFSFKEGDEVINSKPGTMTISGDNGLKKFIATASWEGFDVSEKFSADGFHVKSNIELITSHIWDGTSSLTLDSVKIDDGKTRLDATNLKCGQTVKFDSTKNTLSIGLEYGFDSLLADGEEINNGFARFNINNVDAQAYRDILKTYAKMMNEVTSNINVAQQGNDPEQLNTLMDAQMNKLAFELAAASEKLLKKGLEIQFEDLSVKLPAGEIKGDFALSLKKDMTMMQFAPIIGQPALALDIFSLKSNVKLPAQLVGENPMLLSPVYPGMQTGLFIMDGENMTHTAETRDGKLFLNNQEVVLN